MTEIKDTYKTLAKKSEGYFRDKGSKFIAFAYPINSEEEVKEILNELKKQYYDARHHCYAYRLGVDKDEKYRINEDGEPPGSAAKPIFGQILSYDLTNILIVVIRYFGGTKLGIPGLINAYKTVSKETIANNEIIEK
ncbi:YigZ family protein, partial [Bacteroidales bacterium OttesenSCG-928-K03]|nr:YigZ family protein [Bacteroidales bacterium OttesenSCG-928-K03]